MLSTAYLPLANPLSLNPLRELLKLGSLIFRTLTKYRRRYWYQLRQALNGWEVSPIVTLRSGLPLTIVNGVDANLDGNNTDRAELIGNPNPAHPSAAEWFNVAAFAKNPIITGRPVDGNSGRNTLDAPGLRNVNLAVARNFHLREGTTLQFRCEGSNAFNLVSLGTPGTNVSAPSSFGIIRSAQPMRQLQLGLRLRF